MTRASGDDYMQKSVAQGRQRGEEGAGVGVEEEEKGRGRRRQTVLSLSQRDEINYQTLKLDFQRFLSRHGLSDSTQSGTFPLLLFLFL